MISSFEQSESCTGVLQESQSRTMEAVYHRFSDSSNTVLSILSSSFTFHSSPSSFHLPFIQVFSFTFKAIFHLSQWSESSASITAAILVLRPICYFSTLGRKIQNAYLQYHQLRFIAHQGILFLHQFEPLLHQLRVILLPHACQEKCWSQLSDTRSAIFTSSTVRQGQKWRGAKCAKKAERDAARALPSGLFVSLPLTHIKLKQKTPQTLPWIYAFIYTLP